MTKARQFIRDHRARTGEALSFTGFVISCLGKAVESNRHVQAYRNWRNQLVIYDDVNINTLIEIDVGGQKVAMPHVITAANRKPFRQIHDEIRASQADPSKGLEFKYLTRFLLLPGILRHMFYWVVSKIPQTFRTYNSAVLVTAVGMFGRGTGWGIPMSSFTLTVTLGGIAKKPGVVDERIEIREYLCMTLSMDHDIVDGAPFARFTERLRELIESGYGLEAEGV